MNLILAIDPGGSTGLALISESKKIVSLRVVPLADVYKTIASLARPNVVVIEDFIGGGPRTKEAIYTLKLIGGIMAICELWQMPLVTHVPQQRLPFIQDAKILLSSCIVLGGKPIHAMDALAHALAYIEKSQDADAKSQ